MGYTKEQLLARLQELQIDFTLSELPSRLSIHGRGDRAQRLGCPLSKTLLLKDKKHGLYVVTAVPETKIDLSILSQRLGLGEGGLRRASETKLVKALQVPVGCMTPFALLNDSASGFVLILDEALKSKQMCYFYPLTNDSVIALSSCSLDKFLISIGRQPKYVDLESQSAVVSPPDLPYLIPSNVPNCLKKPVENVPPQNSVPASTEKFWSKLDKPYNHVTIEEILHDAFTIISPMSLSKVSEQFKKDILASRLKKAEAISLTLGQSGPYLEESPMHLSRLQRWVESPTSVECFVDDVSDILTSLLLSEMKIKLNLTKNEIDGAAAMLDGIMKRAAPDLESIGISLKNEAYTEGFHTGLEAAHNHPHWF